MVGRDFDASLRPLPHRGGWASIAVAEQYCEKVAEKRMLELTNSLHNRYSFSDLTAQRLYGILHNLENLFFAGTLARARCQSMCMVYIT